MKYWRTPLDQDRVKRVHSKIYVINDRCKGCGFCIEFCPRHVLQESEDFNRKGYHPVCAVAESECSGCGLCEMICPDFAISVVPASETEASNV